MSFTLLLQIPGTRAYRALRASSMSARLQPAAAASAIFDGMQDDSLDAQLRFAIAHARLIEFTYLGAARVAEPHDYGAQKGQPRLLVYQRRGASSSGRSPKGWKLLDVAKIVGCVVLDETFPGSRGHSHQHHYVWDVVYARVG